LLSRADDSDDDVKDSGKEALPLVV